MSYIRNVLICGVLLAGSLVFSCGGGGGGGTPSQPPQAQPPPTQPPPTQPTTQSVKVSGNVGLGLSRIVGTSATKAQVANLPPAKDASVEITAYDRNGNQTDKKVVKTTEVGSFGTTLTLSNNGGYVVIEIKKEGFADFSKRVDFERPSDINIRAVLDEVPVKVAQVREDFVFSSSTGEKVITFAVFETRTGQKVLKTGRDVHILKQNGQQPTLEIQIPAQPIQQLGIQTLVARLRSFDPIKDADSFPGQYMDSEGNQLVSLGFDYINIQDDKGRNIGQVVRQAIAQGKISKSQAGQTKISRWIGKNSCQSLLKDFCGQGQDHRLCNKLTQDEKNGFNVPVYTYNTYSGLWEMLGIGTIDRDRNGLINTGDVINSLEEAKNLCNNNNGLLLQILVSNEDFLRYWWNIDYPLVMEEPKEVCATLTFKTNNGEPVSGLWVYLYDDDQTQSFSPDWKASDTQGKITFRRTVFGNIDTNAQISFYNPFTWEYHTSSINLGESPNCSVQTITIQKPQVCKVEGVVRYDVGGPIGNAYVYAYSINRYSYTYTNSNGTFSMDVECNLEYDLYVSYTTEKKSFKVDGTASGDEERDDGEKVRLKDITISNQAPDIGGWLSTTSIKPGQSILAYFYGWDQECNTPISWEILVNDQATLSGQSQDCWFYEERDIRLTTEGTYTIKLRATDSQGKSKTIELGQVIVQDNRAPVIAYAFPERVFVPPNTTVRFYGDAYDLDGDRLSYKWYANDIEITSCSNRRVCEYTTPSTEGNITIKFEVSDGRSTVFETFTIRVVSSGLGSGLDIIIQKKNQTRR